ncbi:hypothetical protein [uncultured Kriegella sp.]|uniref:hypothetical protein n=1 Tax=uncultured Kriegella sp. TaxID=1798910 RepID=UPI0030D7A4C0|tara:strand:- start:85337 stop:85981 length:645 start_codon:yes stop_codon:yes gene_type:complete
MMDELELLKKDWQKKEEHLPKLSYEDIYKMIWKKSSSIVKWMFYISIIEFVFWATINLVFTDAESWELFRTLHVYEITLTVTLINYAVLLYFIFKFYSNYRKISFTDSSKKLMKTILSVKRTVTQYVWFNIAIFTVSLVTGLYGSVRYGPDSKKILDAAEHAGNQTIFWILTIGATLVMVMILLLLVWLFYKLLYGILLKRLKKNYEELRQLEI